MNAQFGASNTTSHTGPAILLPYWGSTFRVTQIKESVTAHYGESGPIYRISLSGPIQTKAGNDHKTQTGSKVFTAEELAQSFPEVAGNLYGPGALIRHGLESLPLSVHLSN